MSLASQFLRIASRVTFCVFSSAASVAQSTHYSVKLAPDFQHQLLQGEETIEFQAAAGVIEWQKQTGLHVINVNAAEGDVTVDEQAVRVRWRSNGSPSLKLNYTAAAGRGIRW